jgi:hypothetical protein
MIAVEFEKGDGAFENLFFVGFYDGHILSKRWFSKTIAFLLLMCQ